ncbi:MAG: hypothetical protein KKA79_03255 [Nanoarchaeota archaeon]|nr:hypothetical protein [Nanoarchaeota archaeon]MCG2718759.1 hypothetical protein [Nanoarchaeota archaeon]
MTVFNESEKLQKKVDQFIIDYLKLEYGDPDQERAHTIYTLAKAKLDRIKKIEEKFQELTPKIAKTISKDYQNIGHLWKEYQDLKKEYLLYIEEE